MPNPWLDVPLADYEGHMESPGVQQLHPLAELFAEALAYRRPASVAVLGIAGGNGLDRVDAAIANRVVGVDVNPLYLEAVRGRYARHCHLELHCVDLAEERVDLAPVELVHAALVFEHAGAGLCLENALSLTSPSGALSVVLQLPAESQPNIGPSEFASVQKLKPHFSLVDPAWLREALAQRGFRLLREERRLPPAGKGLWMGIFGRPPR